MFIDTHCHITSDDYDDISLLIEKIKNNGIKKIIVNGTDMKSNLEVLELVRKYDIVYGAIGFHPTELENFKDDDFKWLDEIEFACTYIDTIVRNPKLALIKEENVVKIEKAKTITVASIKDLSRHTSYISKIDKETNDVEPSKILDVRSEETYNIYENRFLYTLIYDIDKIIYEKEKMLKNFKLLEDRVLNYNAKSSSTKENVKIELKITSTGVS